MRFELTSRVRLAATLALALAGAGGASAQLVTAGDPVPGAEWARYAVPVTAGTPPLNQNRPGALIATERYDYGPQSPSGNNLTAWISLDANNYQEAVTLYLAWWNRDTNQVLYYNLATGFTNQERDLFGELGEPAKIVAPDLEFLCIFGDGCALGPLPGNIPTATGKYALVIEVRDGNGSALLSRAHALYVFADAVVSVGGTISNTQTWTANNVYLVNSRVNVTGTLVIQPGTVVLGGDDSFGGIVVAPGGSLIADGAETMPIIFTSRHDYFDRAIGDWFGLVLNGNARTNQQNPVGEGNTGPYGGNNDGDSSGILRYIRVEHAGIRFTVDDESNSIALQGVGSGTVMSHIQTLGGADDGFESFGGQHNIDHLYIRNADDDSYDMAFGARVNIQDLCIVQTAGDEIDHFFELDSEADAPDTLPRGTLNVNNFTAINLRNDRRGALVRRGSAVNLSNGRVFMAPGATQAAFTFDGESSQGLIGTETTFSNVRVDTTGPLAVRTGGNDGPIDIPGLTIGSSGVVDPFSHVDPIVGNFGCGFIYEPWINRGER